MYILVGKIGFGLKRQRVYPSRKKQKLKSGKGTPYVRRIHRYAPYGAYHRIGKTTGFLKTQFNERPGQSGVKRMFLVASGASPDTRKQPKHLLIPIFLNPPNLNR
jgi:hypothetical protein